MARHGFDLDDLELQGHPNPVVQPKEPDVRTACGFGGDAVGADPIFGEGISIALGYGSFALGRSWDRSKMKIFPLSNTNPDCCEVSRSSTVVRWLPLKILYRLRWPWFQKFFWRVLKPIIALFARLVVIDWAKRTK